MHDVELSGRIRGRGKLNSAILEVLNETKTLTPDLGGKSTTMDVSEAIKSKM